MKDSETQENKLPWHRKNGKQKTNEQKNKFISVNTWLGRVINFERRDWRPISRHVALMIFAMKEKVFDVHYSPWKRWTDANLGNWSMKIRKIIIWSNDFKKVQITLNKRKILQLLCSWISRIFEIGHDDTSLDRMYDVEGNNVSSSVEQMWKMLLSRIRVEFAVINQGSWNFV